MGKEDERRASERFTDTNSKKKKKMKKNNEVNRSSFEKICIHYVPSPYIEC